MELKDKVGEQLEEIMTYTGRNLDDLDGQVWTLEHEVRHLRIGIFCGLAACLLLILGLAIVVC